MGLGIALAGIGALAKGISGIGQGIKANRIDRNNIRPVQEVQSEYYKNVADAEQAARMGMPVAQYQQSLQNQQRNLTGGLRTLTRSANPSAGLASLLRASNDATLSLDVNNALQKRQNERFLAGQRGILAGRKDAAFDWNKKSKYLADFSRAQALRGAGAQNLMGALGDVQQIGMYLDDQENGDGQSGGYLAPAPTTPRLGSGYTGSRGLSMYR